MTLCSITAGILQRGKAASSAPQPQEMLAAADGGRPSHGLPHCLGAERHANESELVAWGACWGGLCWSPPPLT